MIEKIKSARNRGSLSNRSLYLLRILLLKFKGGFEVINSNIKLLKYRSKDFLKPDFLVVGMQKSATSWLNKMLRHHVEIYLPELRKEVHYWDKFQSRGIKWYFYHFINAKENQLKGEITPGYSILSTSEIQKIYNFNPELKIIFLLRNPIERDWSQVYMDVVRHQNRNDNMIDQIEFVNHILSDSVRKRGDYYTIIKNWKSVFPTSQMHFEFFENISKEPQNLLNRIFTFLHVEKVNDFSHYMITQKVNSNKKQDIPQYALDILIERYETTFEKLNQFFPNSQIIDQWRIKYYK